MDPDDQPEKRLPQPDSFHRNVCLFLELFLPTGNRDGAPVFRGGGDAGRGGPAAGPGGPRGLKVSFLGSRGIPARYSGFERFVQEVSVRLAQRGHEVTVYNRAPFNPCREKNFEGVRLVRLPTLPTKATDTLVHGGICTLHALARSDGAVLYYCGVGNACWMRLARLWGRVALLNVDGADFARAKWSGFGRWWLRQSERWSGGASRVIADNREIQKRYLREHGIDAEFIPYGTRLLEADPGR
ncbi:MAG: hypothetical protein EBT77_03970, partial [Verrucomicrobia bacterium]|nr:hypothetical protein [Verrucomicrobiota bacterium]